MIALLDELASGVPSVGAPDIERALGLSHASATLVLFSVPGLVGLVGDPLVFLLADRYGRPRVIRIGLAVEAAMVFLAALAPGPVTLACAMAGWFVASGAATAFTETTLIDLWPDRRARTMARWSLLGVAGDLAAPCLLGAIALVAPGGSGWRVAFAIVGVVLAVWAIAVSLRAFPAVPESEDEDEPPLLEAVRDALRDRVLVGWLLGMALCDLLDEILVVFASIYVRDHLGASAAEQSLVIGAFVGGSVVGLVALDRLLVRWSERQLMIAIGAACAAALAAWLAAPAVWLSAVLMVPLGATTAPLYPLATAQAYGRRPGRAGVVLVAGHLFAPIALALPWLLGVVADHAGVLVTLMLLGAQPVGLVTLAAATRRRATTADRDSRDSRTGDAP